MPVEVDLLEQADGDGVVGGPCSDEAIGSSVNSRFSQAPAIVSSARRLVVIASMPSLTTVCAAAGRRWRVDGLDRARR